MDKPTDEELLDIAKQALKTPLTDYYMANIEITARAIVDGTAPRDENWNLALVKMMLLTNYRVRELRSGSI